ncbi:hypothetical protein BV898_13780 [Hypsibius exemplaris]|uniref:Uncharacterized protein n=1 Tax=Hypsibius exemplaris TaxID=2072580 RepID=A0A1W0W9L8_HYPEX|nr:hypothetical protein BV898_13780 [Hypsibius exemplaris]
MERKRTGRGEALARRARLARPPSKTTSDHAIYRMAIHADHAIYRMTIHADHAIYRMTIHADHAIYRMISTPITPSTG